MTSEIIGNWLDCIIDNDYEIYSEYPYPIRRKGSDKIISGSINDQGYVVCAMNRYPYRKHRIIAEQFIPNPDNLPEVDHRNHIRNDNRINNLRWVTASDNARNKSRANGYNYTFLNELPETAEELDSYNGYEFDGLYIDYENKKLYLFNGVRYREVKALKANGILYYQVRDIENKVRSLSHKVLFG